MSFIQYGQLNLTWIDTNEIVREPQYCEDGTTYRDTKWMIDVNCVFNPSAVSYTTQNGNIIANPPKNLQIFPVGVGPINVVQPPSGVGQNFAGGSLPVLTDVSIRQYLSQPRRQLYVYVDNDGQAPYLLLRSPTTANGYTSDERNGPLVDVASVVWMNGLRSWLVRVRFTTYVNECTAQNPILSHRWTRRVETDEHHFAVLATEGEVIFRPTVMIPAGTWPDQYRANFFPPIDRNFQREKVVVIPSSDGLKINYQVVDRENCFNLGLNSVATKVEAYQTGWYKKQGANAAGLEAFDGGNFGGIAAATVLSPFAGLGATARFAGGAAMPAVLGTAPQYYNHIIVRAWGNRNSARYDLYRLAMGIINTEIGHLLFSANGASEIIVTQDLLNKFVEVQGTFTAGAETTALLITGAFGGAANPTGYQFMDALFHPSLGAGAAENLAANYNGLTQNINQGQAGNPAFPYSAGSRGTWQGQLIAQSLSNPCSLPPGPSAAMTSPANGPTRDIIIYNPTNGEPVAPFS